MISVHITCKIPSTWRLILLAELNPDGKAAWLMEFLLKINEWIKWVKVNQSQLLLMIKKKKTMIKEVLWIVVNVSEMNVWNTDLINFSSVNIKEQMSTHRKSIGSIRQNKVSTHFTQTSRKHRLWQSDKCCSLIQVAMHDVFPAFFFFAVAHKVKTVIALIFFFFLLFSISWRPACKCALNSSGVRPCDSFPPKKTSLHY